MILSDLDNIAYNKFANGEITLAEYLKYQNRDKIMNYEEKAKRYDEALERMKSWARGEHPDCFSEAQKAAEFIFPELAENEDERIRKELIQWFDDFPDSIWRSHYKKDILAWLEKQGEQKQTWKPSAAQLIVIKDLIDGKDTSNVNKVILRGMLDEFKQNFGLC